MKTITCPRRTTTTPRLPTTGRPGLRIGFMALFGLAVLVFASSNAWAQMDTSSIREDLPSTTPGANAGTETAPYYIPGMPVPEQGGEEAAADGEKKGTNKGGRVSTVRWADSKKGLDQQQQPRIDRSKLTVNEMYRGIVPGIRDWHLLPRRARDRAKKNPGRRNRLTWLGYQNVDDGSRVFIQTIKEAGYSADESQTEEGQPTIAVTLLATRVPIYNNRRALDTRYFPTAVIGAEATPVGRNTVVTLTLQKKVPFSVRQDGEFIFIDLSDDGTTPFAEKQQDAVPAENKSGADAETAPAE